METQATATATTPTATATTTTKSTKAGKESVMGKQDFLKLLIAQLQNQDPLKPSDPMEFTAQLAQFSSLEQLFSVNDALEKMATGNAALEKFSTMSLIGKDIAVSGDSFSLAEGSDGIDLGYSLDGPATAVSMEIKNALGQTVAVLEGDKLGRGQHFMHWDGTDADGLALPAGKYSLSIKAVATKGATVTVKPLVTARVEGVDLSGATSLMVTSAGDFSLSQVISVREAAEKKETAEEATTTTAETLATVAKVAAALS